MSNLTPEKRPDKTGKVVTRWVLPAASAANRTALPAPSVDPESKSPLLDILGDAARDVDFKDYDPRVLPLLEHAIEAARGNPKARSVLGISLRENFYRIRGDSSVDEPRLHNLAVLAEPILVWGEKLSEIEPFVNGLNRYPKFEHVSDLLLDCDNDQRVQARALVFAAFKLDERFVESIVGISEDYSDEEGAWDIEPDDELMEQYITNQKLARLIMDHPDKVERIVERLGQDPDIDLDRLRIMVNHGQQSLADGVL